MLKTAYRAVKDADPTAKVLTGGMAGNAVPYLEDKVLDAEVQDGQVGFTLSEQSA